ncbi:MAG: ATP-binding protein [Kiritimatiellae bacterium]|nr:ATP-binding protein [Kiritimatiellia bacterium]
MQSNVISVNTFDTVDVKEDQKTEFKTSIFFDPETHSPGVKQMSKIARTMAAFMNADGGMLYVGVTDDKQIKGIEGDLEALELSTTALVAHSSRHSDKGCVYYATPDHYELKIRAIAKAFLGNNASKYIGSILVKKMGGKPVCRIELKPCPKDEFVYAYWHNPVTHVEVAEIIVRTGNQNTRLEGEKRDEFVTERVKAGFDAQLKAVRESVAAAGTGAHGADAVLASVRELLAKIDAQHVQGEKITVSGGQPFTEEAVTATKRPKALAWEGQHYAEVSGWQELVLKVLEKLQEIDAAKFDELAGRKEFLKQLIRIRKPKEKHPECYPVKFGAEGKVRIKKSLGNKVYLWQEDKVLRKIIAAFGVDVSKFMFVAG